MNISKPGVLLITHEGVGAALRDTVTAILGTCPLAIDALAVPMDADPDRLAAQALRLATALDQGGGVLVLTDLFGATPANIACRLLDRQVRVVAGLNLPMLLKICNYHLLSLDALADRAVSGGREGILACDGAACGCGQPGAREQQP